MKVSLHWLKDYVDIEMGIKELVDLLTMAGLEVEGATSTGKGLERVIVAEILSIHKHPNADRLLLVEVKTDREKFSIVCGATNIKEGQKVPLALIGSCLPNGVEIKKSKIRGVTSEGMLCSEIELGLGQDVAGIMILPPHTPLGMEIGDALGLKDTLLDISITPNRSDCLCVIGIAREIAALTHQKLRYPMIALSDRGEEIHQKTTVTILDPDLCPRYVARMVEGMKIGPSPFWMRDRLKKVGIRSINNVVDVTNYVMMEYGQPLHAFDFKLLEEGRIVVRRAKEGETFTTLDGVERKLDGQMLMICDGVKLVAIAGVMGGINSEIKEDTETVLLESAYFDPMGNRRTAKELGLETEAAYHFSRGVDYGGTPIAASRAVQLIQELAGGRVVEGVVDMYPKPIPTPPIRLRTRKVNQLLGTEILANRMRAYLEGLGLKVRVEDEETLMVIPPTFRRDLEREIDLIEEIARMDGYEKIPATLPKGSATFKEKKKEFLMERKMLEVLIHYGYYEVVTYSFTSPASLDSIRLVFNDRRREQIQILNPLSEDFSTLRTSLIPGLLETARYNAFRKNSNLKLFELKRVFLPQEGERLPKESKYLSGLAMGFDAEPHWALVQRPIDFHDIKGCVEDLLAVLQINHFKFKRAEDIPYLHPGKAARVLLGEEVLGILGEVHPQVLSHYEIHGKAYLFEMDFGQLVKWAVEEKRFKPLPKFPPIYRDLSLVVDEAMAVEKVVEAIWAIQHPFIDKVNLFDVYRGVPIPDGKKSVSYRIRYQSENRTLTDDEVNQYHEEVISSLKEIFKVELRQ